MQRDRLFFNLPQIGKKRYSIGKFSNEFE